MTNNELYDLIQQLNGLQIELTELNKQQTDIGVQQRRIITSIESALNEAVRPPDRVIHLVSQTAQTAQPRSSPRPSPNVIPSDVTSYKPRDKVRIINIPKKLKNGHITTEQDRLATVVSISGDRVQLITDNGANTWRITKNIRKLSQSS